MENNLTRRGFFATAAATLAACATTELTNTKKGPRIEKTKEGTQIIYDAHKQTIREVNRVLQQCGPKEELDELAKNKCKSDITRTKERGMDCLRCTYTAEVLD